MSELDQYDYHLPAELVAQQPLANRADSRLMVVDRRTQTIEHAYVRDLPDLLRAGDALVLNDSRVIPARVVGRRLATGGRWEGLFLAADGSGCWQLLAKSRGRLGEGEEIQLVDRAGADDVQLKLVARLTGGVWIARVASDQSTWEILDRIGHTPLPPYIRRGRESPDDHERYQTVYARVPGSSAAPTAGLHFTPELLQRLATAGIEPVHVTLHVGLDTFRPVTVQRLDEHTMHAEWAELSPRTAARLIEVRRSGGRIVAVGTTAVRILETASASGELTPFAGHTRLFIRPPYTFRNTDVLMTNFHFPKSTLLVLVRTFGGDTLMRRAYDEAIRERYRFFSYGDAMLIV